MNMNSKKLVSVSLVVMQIFFGIPVFAEEPLVLRPPQKKISADPIDELVGKNKADREVSGKPAAREEDIREFLKKDEEALYMQGILNADSRFTGATVDVNDRGVFIIKFKSGDIAEINGPEITFLDKAGKIIEPGTRAWKEWYVDPLFTYIIPGSIAVGSGAKALTYLRNARTAASAGMVTARTWNAAKGGYDTAKAVSTATKILPRAASATGGVVGTSRLIPVVGAVVTSGFFGNYIGSALRDATEKADKERVYKNSLDKDITTLSQLEDCKIFTSSAKCRGVDTSDARRDALIKNISNNYSRLNSSQYPYIFTGNSVISEANKFRNDNAYIYGLLYDESGNFIDNAKNIDKILNPVNPSRN